MSDEILDIRRLPDGRMEATVRLDNGLTVVRGVESVELEATVVSENGDVEDLGLVAASYSGRASVLPEINFTRTKEMSACE